MKKCAARREKHGHIVKIIDKNDPAIQKLFIISSDGQLRRTLITIYLKFSH